MKYLVVLRSGSTVNIVADDVDGGDSLPYFNFWKSRGTDSSVTVAAIPIDQVVYITGEETKRK
jgi:hypothetical protein